MSKEFELDKDGNVKETFHDVMRAYDLVFGKPKKITDNVDHYALCKTCIHNDACGNIDDVCYQYDRTECDYYLKDTRAEFAEKMKEFYDKYGDDEELVHEKMDDLMCETLRSLGYGEGVDIFENTHKWYA